jgi:amino acid adenylation domain-containing protein
MNDITTIRAAIDGMAAAHAEREFLLSPETGGSVSFAELREQSTLLSRMLHEAGLEHGDKVAFLMDNGLVTAQLFLGTMYGGFVAVPLNVRAGVVQLSYMLDHCDAKVVFVEQQYRALLGEALGSVRRDLRVIAAEVDGPLPAFEAIADGPPPTAPAADDAALLMYSSGSTGKPKGAIHTHSSVLAHGWNSIESHHLTAADRSLLVLPLYHINAECVTLTPTLLSGGSVVVAHRFVVSRFWDWVDDLHITWSALVPTIISELVDWDDPGKDRRQAAFARIRFFRSSSAPLSPTLHQQFLDKFKLPLLQAMGSTEGGNVFSNPQPPARNKIGSPGLPWGFETRIVDREGTDVAAGESGEVLLRGAGLMKGYYKDPEGTAAVVDGQGWLHTGDLARQDEDGYFFVVGRSKELIIKGGVNIAPRQIDDVLESHPAVVEAAAVGVPDRYFGEDAVAFVVLRSGVAADEKELLAYCESRLGHFKTPSRIHFLKELPKGPSGKVQRLRLLDPAVLEAVAATAQPQSDAAVINAGDNGSDRSTSLEQIIAAAWAEVLALPQVDNETNFFALGGHSLLAIQCLSKLRSKLPIVLSLTDFFENPTVAEQAELVKHRLRPVNGTGAQECADSSADWEQSLLRQYVPPPDVTVIPRQNRSVPHPLSPGQQGLWFFGQLNPGLPVYNEAEAVRLTGKLNVDALERAMNAVVDRHEVLRSTIKIIGEVPHGLIHQSWPLRFKKIDLRALPEAAREAEVDRLLIDEPRVPYNLEAEPGIRVTLLHLSEREHVLILMMHHIVCDWASEGIIWRDLSAVYGAIQNGEPMALPALAIDHGDYATWQQQRLATTDFGQDLVYWEQTLRGAPALLELPADRPRPPVMSYQGDRIRWKLNRTLTEALRNTSRIEKTSLFTIFAAALDTLIYRYSGNDDIPLGIPLADRDLPALQAVVGYLLRMHVLRTRLTGEMTFRDLLSLVQKGALDLYLHRAVPFDQIVQKLQPERNLSYTPLFQVALNWRDRDQMLSFIGLEGLAIDSLMATAATAKFDLLLVATDIGDEIWLELEYNTDIYDRDRMSRMLGHYQTLLESVAADTTTPLAEIPLLIAGERQQLLFDWNDTAAEFPAETSLAELVEDQVQRTPDATAVVCGEHRLTYQELNTRANQLAHELLEYGAGPEQVVGLYVERSIDMVVALLAIVKTGAAYLPLDPIFPAGRLGYMLEDSGARLLVTERNLVQDVAAFAGRTILLEDGDRRTNRIENRNIPARPGDPGCLIYTSGSTGRPKGVQVGRKALVNLFWSMRKWLKLSERDRLLAVTTISFDIAGVDMWLPLLVGAQTVIASREAAADGNALRLLLDRHDITFLQATPSTWKLLFEAAWQGKSNLQAVCTGEAMPPAVAAQLAPVVERLWNLYGPTETTIWSTGFAVTDGKPPILIGRPVANTQIYILDKRKQPVPTGIPGELYIGGDGLAQGYLNRAELTEEKFVADPFRGGDARMYRTGDIARYRVDGNIECLGRIDHQVKIRGYRIELGEIEKTLEAQLKVKQAVVIAREDTPGEKQLVAYYTSTAETDAVDPELLRSHLSASLPEYMVPAAYVRLAALPLTPNGKLDRKALPAPDAGAFSTRGYEPPQGELEEKLAEVWAEVLKLDRVGRHDNFFDLGGHSLLAVQLMLRLQKLIPGVALPLRSLLEAPTVERYAVWLESHEPTRQQILVQMQPGNPAHPPFFCLPAPDGTALGMRPLAMALDKNVPFYCLQHKGLDGTAPLNTVEEAACCYLEEVRKVQPHGPYYLGGYCFGGVVAFEMARMLELSGETVTALFLIDSFNPAYLRFRPTGEMLSRLIRFYIRRAALHTHRMRSLRPGMWLGYTAGRLKAMFIHGERFVKKTAKGNQLPVGPQAMEIIPPAATDLEKNLKMMRLWGSLVRRKFEPQPYCGDAIVFRASERDEDPYEDYYLGWRPLVRGSMQSFEFESTHESIFRDPTVRLIAEKINARFRQAVAEEDPSLHAVAR